MRTFLALNLPPATREALFERTSALRAAAPGASWVAHDNLHLTLQFLGDVDDERLAAVAARLLEIAATHRRLLLDIGGAGAFPNLGRPRIVWMGVAPDPRLELLQHDLERGCESLGFPVEGRAFRPHITLGRIRLALPPAERATLVAALSGCTFRERVAVETVDLMDSALGQGGSRYTVLVAAALGEEI
ncbi:MAG TPA: RNA 2',3'-cyclic phosphodiesterase [Gemmatimonadaceae bacterium]|nr:RNA 2',3'-cyclic phosphodiesterase [Gemmatimonadaceae bacterium]